MTTQIRSIGDLVKAKRAAANSTATAGGTGDNTEVAGVIIDRAAIGFPQSALVVIPYTATLGAGESLSLAYDVESGEASNLSDATPVQAATSAVIASSVGGGTVTGEFTVDVPLAGAGRYVRLNYTPNLSRANTDTAALSSVIVFGGMDRLPQ